MNDVPIYLHTEDGPPWGGGDRARPAASRDPRDEGGRDGAAGGECASVVADPAPAPRRRVMGLDLSLRHTGIADCDGFVGTVATKTLRGFARVQFIWDAIEQGLWAPCDLAVVEGYANAAQGSSLLDLAELGGVVRWNLHLADVPMLIVPPTQLKIYATGKGQANKAEMIIAARDRLGYGGTDDNEADAMWLRAIGLALLGEPVVELPKTHTRVLPRITWPAGVEVVR